MVSHHVLNPRLNKAAELLAFIEQDEGFVGFHDEVGEGGCGVGVYCLVFAEVGLRGGDGSGGFLSCSEDFAGVDAEPATDFSEGLEVWEVSAFDTGEGGGAGSDLFGGFPDAFISSFFNDF